jgi:class 3 adenylate cyclase
VRVEGVGPEGDGDGFDRDVEETGFFREQLELTTPLQAIINEVQTDRPDLGGSSAPDGTVTMLFTDIEGSTELAERLADSDWTELIRWHRRDTTQSARAYRGYVVKSLGDGFMVAFPSASDAIRCAQIVRDSAALGWHGNPVRLRAGIHSGMPFVTSTTSTATL